MKKVTGIGGIFFKTEEPEKMRDWYAKYLGVPVLNQYGAIFEGRDAEDPDHRTHLVWNTMKKDSTYFHPSLQTFMINFRVADLEALLQQLKQEGVEQVGEMEVYDYGKFAWILDPDGNKIELWEPNDPTFRKMNGL
jgi:catechol 2,3-dioxygenase-like lactoylglutathione lyase family enzyme